MALCLAGVGAAEAPDLQQAIDEQVALNREAVASQKRIDAIHDEIESMLVEQRSARKQLDSLDSYNTQMRQLIASQEQDLASLREQLDGVAGVARATTPLMERMIDSLDAFVRLDLPFLLEERRGRIEELRSIMRRADVTNAEKYRRIVEAYDIEIDYGRTIESYRGEVDAAGEVRVVDLLRIGRVALVYQSLDGSSAGMWSQRDGRWLPLDASYLAAIERGLRIARQQSTPGMIEVPVPVPPAPGNRDVAAHP